MNNKNNDKDFLEDSINAYKHYNEFSENKDNLKLFCINCGKRGHLSKKCLCPIMSIGIICIRLNIDNLDINNIIGYTKKLQNNYLFSSDEITKLKKIKKKIDNYFENNSYEDLIEFLLIRRKNSLNYVEFIRGKYDINNLDYLETTINFITNEEKEDIKNNNFDTLWKKLWNSNNINSNEYLESKEKFNLLKSGFYIKKNEINFFVKLEKLMENNVFSFNEPEWGFPKGRRNLKEKNIECAKREFQEETNLTEEYYNILNIIPFEESYMAINSIKYKHIYYTGQINNLKSIDNILLLNNNNELQKIEIGDIKWFKFKESFDIIRDYNITKKVVLLNLFLDIKNIIDNFNNLVSNF